MGGFGEGLGRVLGGVGALGPFLGDVLVSLFWVGVWNGLQEGSWSRLWFPRACSGMVLGGVWEGFGDVLLDFLHGFSLLLFAFCWALVLCSFALVFALLCASLAFFCLSLFAFWPSISESISSAFRSWLATTSLFGWQAEPALYGAIISETSLGTLTMESTC